MTKAKCKKLAFNRMQKSLKISILLLFLVLQLLYCAFITVSAGEKPYPWLIIPGQGIGKITKNTSKADLQRIYGSKNVKEAPFDQGEGDEEPGIVLFPNDPSKKLSIRWKDKRHQRFPLEVEIRFMPHSLWKTGQGITLGTDLKTIERLNGKPFKLAGFGWDYGGTVISWNEGKLEKVFSPRNGIHIFLRLGPEDYETPMDKRTQELYYSVASGDFSSHNPAMQQLKPKVYDILINFNNGKR
jgi:hypothetical protein